MLSAPSPVNKEKAGAVKTAPLCLFKRQFMKEYEMVREIKNLCPNNQMRDIFFDEVETEDPVAYVRDFLKGKAGNVHSEPGENGAVTVYADCDGLIQKFIFTPV